MNFDQIQWPFFSESYFFSMGLFIINVTIQQPKKKTFEFERLSSVMCLGESWKNSSNSEKTKIKRFGNIFSNLNTTELNDFNQFLWLTKFIIQIIIIDFINWFFHYYQIKKCWWNLVKDFVYGFLLPLLLCNSIVNPMIIIIYQNMITMLIIINNNNNLTTTTNFIIYCLFEHKCNWKKSRKAKNKYTKRKD